MAWCSLKAVPKISYADIFAQEIVSHTLEGRKSDASYQDKRIRLVMELDKDSFEVVVGEEDSRLVKANTPIPARPIQAIIAIFRRYGVSGPIVHPHPESSMFPVTPFNLSEHVNEWYRKRYGEKLKIDPSPGRFPVMIGGAVYSCRLPLTIGKFLVVGAKGRFRDKSVLNAIDFVSDLPNHVRDHLCASTENLAQVLFFTCLEVTKELRSIKSPLLVHAKSDILISCDLLSGYNVNVDLSAWHALQFAEKVLKEFISRSGTHPHTHNIENLRDKASTYGYNPDGRINWQLFGFNASVRYDPPAIDIQRAVAMNHEAWRIGFNVLKQI